MKFNERKEKIINYLKIYGTITNNDAQALTNAHRNTITGDFKKLCDEKILEASGSGKGIKYVLVEDLIFLEKNINSIFSAKDKHALNMYLKKNDRKKVFFNKIYEKALNTDFTFSNSIENSFLKMKNKIDDKRKILSSSERKRKKEKLVIDLSWASSHIEGNTYTLLETETLIKYNETSQGKSYFEAKMILNHKNAIQYIRESKQYKKLSKRNILELHQLLIDDLEINTGFREHLVNISHSVFVPCDNKFQIISTVEDIINKINQSTTILQKALTVNLLIPFLQPFSDGNKRTSRMLGNAILLSYNYLPISFSHTPKEEYIKSILYFYEKQNPNYFKQLFINELNKSFIEYIG